MLHRPVDLALLIGRCERFGPTGTLANIDLFTNVQTRTTDVSSIVLRCYFRWRSDLGIMVQSTGVSFT